MEYVPVIGLEVHAELATKSKLFCGCSVEFGAEPNTQTCPVCLGMPGVLPVMNRSAFDYVVRTALALNCEVPSFVNFDRKNYYYPDLPKNYQISQSYHNIGTDGWIEILVDGKSRRVGILNVHLEEDAGKLVHTERADYSLVDLNRAGVPLLEIVTAPDMHDVDEVEAFMKTLRATLIYLGVSDCKMEQGSLRFEASVSVKEADAKQLGNRVEVKNLNSIRSVVRVVEYEMSRQTACLERGEAIPQETRLWDEVNGRSERMRSKEEAHDYRYFPEPDLVPATIEAEWLEEMKGDLPELPLAKRLRFVEQYGISDYNAAIVAEDRLLADYFERCMSEYDSPKTICNWLVNDLQRILNEKGIEISQLDLAPEKVARLVRLVDESEVNVSAGREILDEMVASGKEPDAIVGEKGLSQISDEKTLTELAEKIVAESPRVVADWKSGKKNALNALIGPIMRETRGKANPQIVREVLKQALDRS